MDFSITFFMQNCGVLVAEAEGREEAGCAVGGEGALKVEPDELTAGSPPSCR